MNILAWINRENRKEWFIKTIPFLWLIIKENIILILSFLAKIFSHLLNEV